MEEKLTHLDGTFDEILHTEMPPEFAMSTSGETLSDELNLGQLSTATEVQPFGSQMAEELPEDVGIDTLDPRATMPTGKVTTSFLPTGKRGVDDTKVTDKDENR